MTPQQFVKKWTASTLKESSASQEHFIDLCRLTGEQTPAEVDPDGSWYCFERGAKKTGGGDGWADVWRRGYFAWEYKGKHKDLTAAFAQLQRYAIALENPPLLVVSDMDTILIHTNFTNTVQKTGAFDVPGITARTWLIAGGNPNGRSNADVLAPYWNGLDLVRRPRDYWIIDFGWKLSESDSSLYELPFKYVTEFVRPDREKNVVEALRRDWWRLWRPRPEMRKQIETRKRYIVTPEVSKHRVFGWLELPTLPDKNLVVIARADDVTFGVVHSRMHELWSLRLGTSLEDRPRYTPSTTFETFPFPPNMTPAASANGAPTGVLSDSVAAAAKRLDELRGNWLNPPDWLDIVPEVVSGFPGRFVPKPGREADLKKRTLTNLYNERPTWLVNAHHELDVAVACAYGWNDYAATMPDEEVLSRLLSLNLERSAAAS